MAQQLLYHEKQQAALCGVHCVNTLLQGPYFNEIELAEIAQELDAAERRLLYDQQAGAGPEEHGNVAADGMFSIQVLGKALATLNLDIIPLDNPEVADAKRDPQSQEAFICNLLEHWFAIRKMGTEWYNFNSLFPAPQHLSQFYLSAFLDTLREQGYTIFLVRGPLPAPQPPQAIAPGRWFTPEEAQAATKGAEAARHRGRVNNALEHVFSRAAQQGGAVQLQSRKRHQTDASAEDGGFGAAMEDDEDADLAAAIAASLGGVSGGADADFAGFGSGAAGPSRSAAGGVHGGDDEGAGFGAAANQHSFDGGAGAYGGVAGGGGAMDDDDDPELAAAIAASLATAAAEVAAVETPPPASVEEEVPVPDEPPAADPSALDLAFRLPNGQRSSRRFLPDAPAKCLYAFLKASCGLDPAKHVLCTQFPRKELPRDGSTLAELGLTTRTMLSVEVRR